MAMRSYKKTLSVGIKELKDRASEIIALVQRTGQAVSITKNQQEVARIMPVPADARERLITAGLVQPGPKPLPLSERSEERRVGKECRLRWWPEYQKKKYREAQEGELAQRRRGHCGRSTNHLNT